MIYDKFFEKLSPFQKELSLRIFDLVLGRVLTQVYLGFNEKTRQEMEKIFSSNNDREKEKFIKTYIPDFENFFKKELKKIEEEIKVEIKKRI